MASIDFYERHPASSVALFGEMRAPPLGERGSRLHSRPVDVNIDVEAADDTDMEASVDMIIASDLRLPLPHRIFATDKSKYRNAGIICATTRKTCPRFHSSDLSGSTPYPMVVGSPQKC